ncbi:hypothetical protein [Paracoccus sp. PAR01]|uniref:hypothetical protein n=1 Tax=Paracoccus sp. PAR01 TaxID=2769282 RepID=UPI001781F484|nr:hypothetical protein [Paracoccus sp. PAR01]MBD9528186.1 hypothetical protein [Paracoccus sp. PAR01]
MACAPGPDPCKCETVSDRITVTRALGLALQFRKKLAASDAFAMRQKAEFDQMLVDRDLAARLLVLQPPKFVRLDVEGPDSILLDQIGAGQASNFLTPGTGIGSDQRNLVKPVT